MKASIHCVVLVNYMTSRLTEVLETMGNDGYKLVSVVMAKDIVKQDCMYLFFQKNNEGSYGN